MAIPPFRDLVRPVLQYFAGCDGPVHVAQIRDAVAKSLNLTTEDRGAMLSNGAVAFDNRVSWAINWTKRAGLAVSPVRSKWQLSETGRHLLTTHPTLPSEVLATFEATVTKGRPTVQTSAPNIQVTVPPVGDRRAYRLPSQPIASGGQADVFVAVRKFDERKFAIKKGRRTFGDRMKREIEVQSKLVHPNIMPIVDWDIRDYRWYVMPLGSSVMADLVRPLSFTNLREIIDSVTAALEFAHAGGNPHRDVKPANVIKLVDETNGSRWVLSDWGLTRRAPGTTTSRLTKTGQLLGTEGFAPPEAYKDAHNVGALGDIYSLGQLVAWAAGHEPIPNISATAMEPWRSFVERLTQQSPLDRPQTMAEVRLLLADIHEP